MSKKILGIIIGVLIVVIITLLVPTVLKEEKTGQGITFEPMQDGQTGYVNSELPEISIPGWGAIKLPANAKEADVALFNPETNAGYYNLSFTLKLADTGEVVFTTGKIEPGYQCTRVTLTRELEIGEYNAVMFVQPYLQDEDETPTNNAEMEIMLIVEN